MATLFRSRDENASPRSGSSAEISPGSTPRPPAENESLKQNAYVSSPLRFQDGNSVNVNKPLPKAPTRPLRVNTDDINASSTIPAAPPTDGSAFPFEAGPGSIGPAPTTADIAAIAARTGDNEEPSPKTNGRKRQSAGTATPPERRSVQFARGTNEEAGPTPVGKTLTWDTDDDGGERYVRGRQASGSFFSKLKEKMATATPHTRTPSDASAGFSTPHAALSPQSERSEPMYPIPTEEVEGGGTEADEEDSGEDGNTETRPKRPRKRKRPVLNGTESAPTTPRASRFASFIRDHPLPGRSSSRPPPSRNDTVSEESDDGRAGVSEDEGRDRLRAAWRRGIEGARNISTRKDRDDETGEQRPGTLRRLTGFGGGGDSSTPFRQRADRHNSASAQKWRQVKAGIKMLGQRQKNERVKIDHQKSAQLMAELLAGAPAALIFASMFQRDEHQHRKVPVLLEQLKISIPDVQSRTENSGDRDYIFKVNLEYGNGPARMQWTIYRSITDFVNLHLKYKAQEASDRVKHLTGEDKTKPKIPRFPKSAIPYARGIRGLLDRVQDEEDELEIPETPGIGTMDGETAANTAANVRPGTAGRGHRRKTSSFFAPPRRQSTSEIGNRSLDPDALTARQKLLYAEKSRQKLEVYLQSMIRWLIFRPDSTRLCKFLELSAMAIRLSAENGYQGKQGLLQIASRRHREMRRKTLQTIGPHAFKERHKRRWFLVRHSYIVCVDGPESLVPYDVFLVDPDFSVEKKRKKILDQKTPQDMARIATENATPGKKAHLIQLYNSERKIKLYARNEKQYLQFRDSINHMMNQTLWSQKHRYASFAPVRNKVWSRWLVDGRDHMWQVSRAIDNARDSIYIHDWWLSPELYMRRPAAISQKWRLDRLLQRKAQEGVKIFVIVYRNVESAIPIDSEYTKWSLMDLHPNICVQRSPNQFRQNQFFWAHHEKLVIVDNMMAFVGGVDLCFGRWDDPCHTLTDDKLTGFELDQDVPRDSEHCQMWPGKDYSNPRVQDFYNLDRPYEEMYDRTKVPRMPWHDIAMQIVGQPARDVARHFVQRWNFILRSRVPSRPTPVLMPPPEYDFEELNKLGMTGTCEIQLLRSAAHWSLGTPNKVEHSIMSAYCHLIKNSDYFVYIENQFFITSTTVDSTRIVNKIGDAIVERAKRAHDEGKPWQVCIVIPLMPGFQSSVDAQDGTSIRLIMSCQYRSICRGEDSIFGRLRAYGIDPEDYVRFYSLRQWGKIGPRECLTTEQLYIHAKCMVVDDRTVIIGSANINERSMLGNRDSEVAAVVTDTDMVPSFMGGEPYLVGKFAHTLRMRLMREHLGIDVDAIYRREQIKAERDLQDAEMQRIYNDKAFTPSREYFETPPQTPLPQLHGEHTVEASANGTVGGQEDHGTFSALNTQSSQSTGEHEVKDFKKGPERELDVEGYGPDNMKKLTDAGDVGFRDSFVDAHGREVLLRKDAPDSVRIKEQEEAALLQQRSEDRERKQSLPVRPPWPTERLVTRELGLPTRSTLPDLPAVDDTDIGGPALTRGASQLNKAIDPLAKSLSRPDVHEDCMSDPLASSFFHDIWHKVAENNTKIYRQVFRCQPDSEVLDWRAYEKANDYQEHFMQSQGLGKSTPRARNAPVKSGPPGAAGGLSPIQDSSAESVKSKGVFAGLREKLRPGTRNGTEPSHTEEMHENEKRNVPDSPESGVSSGPTVVPSPDPRPLDEKVASRSGTPSDEKTSATNGEQSDEKEAAKQDDPPMEERTADNSGGDFINRLRTVTITDSVNYAPETTATQTHSTQLSHTASQKRRRRGTAKSISRPLTTDVMGRDEAEDLLELLQGHLVTFPYDWLEKEERNWLYAVDQLAPLEIYD